MMMIRGRLIIVTAFLAVAMTFIPDFAIFAVPIQDEFSLSIDDMSALQFVPDIASLLMVFVAAALAIRLGRRVTLALASASFAAGALAVSFAPVYVFLLIGLTLIGIGSVIAAVVGLSLINIRFTDASSRGKAFGVVAALSPIIALLVPNVSAFLTTSIGWRSVPLLWAGVAVLLLALALTTICGEETRLAPGELLSPVLGGVALATFCYAFTTLAAPGIFTAIGFAISFASSGVLIVLLRRQGSHGFDVRVLLSGSGIRAALAIVLIWGIGLSFYASLYLQFRFDYDIPSATLILTIVEFAAILGGVLFGFIAGRIGSRNAALIASCAGAILSLVLSLFATTSDPWRIVFLTSLVAFAGVGAIGPITEHFLNHAPKDGSDGASAIADAMSSVGFVAVGAIVSVLIFSGFASSLASGLEQRGYPPHQSQHIAAEIRSGVASEELVARDIASDPQLRDALITDHSTLNDAQGNAYRIMGLAYMGIFIAAVLLLLPNARRQQTAFVDASRVH